MKRYIETVYGRIMTDVKEYGMAVVALFIYTVVVNLVFRVFCPLVIFTGFPCPGCGITRASVCLLAGRWGQAWQLNPVVFPVMAAAVYFAVNRYLLGKKARGFRWMIIAVFVLLLAVYCIRMYLYFPERVPYIYTHDNILARMFPFYGWFLHEAGVL